MTVWTKKNVERAYTSELVEWNNKIVADLNRAEELKVEMPRSEKVLKLIVAELKKRKAF